MHTRQHCRLSICSYFGWVWQNLRRAGLSSTYCYLRHLTISVIITSLCCFHNKFPVFRGGHPGHLVHRDHHGVHHAGRSYVPQLGGLGYHLLRLLLLHHPHHGQHLVRDENLDFCHQIGFGDLVPTRSFFAYEEARLAGKLQVLAAVGYCVLGIAIIAMCISFIQVRKHYPAILPSLPFIAPIDLNVAFSVITTIAIIAMLFGSGEHLLFTGEYCFVFDSHHCHNCHNHK